MKFLKQTSSLGLLSTLLFLMLMGPVASAQDEASTEMLYTQYKGEPFFVKGLYHINPRDFAKVASYGFNVVHSYDIKKLEFEEMRAYLDSAHANGLKVMFSISFRLVKQATQKSYDQLERIVSAFKDHDALWGWYLFDEPSENKGITPERLEEVYSHIKRLDPDHLVYVSNWELRKYKDGTDVDMRQLYYGRATGMRKVLATGYPERVAGWDKQWIAILNFFDSKFMERKAEFVELSNPARFYQGAKKQNDPEEFEYRMSRAKTLQANLLDPFDSSVVDPRGLGFKKTLSFPGSADVMRGQAMSAIVYGSNALFWWMWQHPDRINPTEGYYTTFHYRRTRDEIKPMLSDLDKIGPMLVGEKEVDTRWNIGPLVYRLIRDPQGREALCIVNETTQDYNGVLSLDGNSLANASHFLNGEAVNIASDAIEVRANSGIFLTSYNGTIE